MISGLLVKHGWYMVWVITDVRQQKHPTSRFQRDFVDELILHLLVGRCSASHCGLGRALPYIRPVLCVSSCPPLSAQTQHTGWHRPESAALSRLCSLGRSWERFCRGVRSSIPYHGFHESLLCNFFSSSINNVEFWTTIQQYLIILRTPKGGIKSSFNQDQLLTLFYRTIQCPLKAVFQRMHAGPLSLILQPTFSHCKKIWSVKELPNNDIKRPDLWGHV